MLIVQQKFPLLCRIIQVSSGPESLVMSRRDFSGEERHCVPFLSPEKVELPQRGERVGTAHGVFFMPWLGRLPSTYHCNLISYSKKWTFLFQSMQIYPSKVYSWCGLLWCFYLGPQYLPDVYQSPLFYFPFCLLGAFSGLPLVTWLSDKDWISSARDYQKCPL